MNTSLIKELTKKWSQLEGMPGKGYELVREENGLSPCAQSEAIMISKGMGVMDFQAFWKGLTYGNSGLNLDEVTAKTLGISVIHSILLRRFNDLSSQSPAIVLNEPEKILGENWGKVSEFWHFVDSITQGQWEELLEALSNNTKQKEYESRKKDLKLLTETLDVITPDLYYLLGHSEPLDPTLVERKTEEEVAKLIPEFKVSYSSNQHAPRYLPGLEWLEKYPNDTAYTDNVIVVGDYSRAYFGWIAAADYVLTNLPSGFNGISSRELQVLLACATNEIQTLRKGQSYEDLYFCKIVGYNPLKGNTIRKVQRKVREHKQSLLANLNRFYRIVDNSIFSRLSKDENVRKAPTKEMIEGLLELTEDDIVSGKAYGKILETYDVGMGRFFGYLEIQVPRLGPNSEADTEFYQLIKRLKDRFDVWPVSFCDVENPISKEGSVWAVRLKNEVSQKRRVNVPGGWKEG
jgi:hypothetical protein